MACGTRIHLERVKETSSPFGLKGHDGVATQPSAEEQVSMSTITIGVDSAKSVFSVCEMAGTGHILRRPDLKRDAFAVWLAQVPAGTVVAMKACSGEHHWAGGVWTTACNRGSWRHGWVRCPRNTPAADMRDCRLPQRRGPAHVADPGRA